MSSKFFHRTGDSRLPLLGLLSLFALALLLRLPAIVQGFRLNQAAVQAAVSCEGNSREPTNWLDDAEASSLAHTIWLAATVAHCHGDTQTSRQELHKLLSMSGAQLDLVRTIAPNDIELARFASEQYPVLPIASSWLGDALRLAGDDEGAIRAYERSVELTSTDADMWFALGRLYEEKRKDLPAAAKAYDQACFHVDHGKNGCLAASFIYLTLGQDDLAAERHKEYLRQVGLPEDAPR